MEAVPRLLMLKIGLKEYQDYAAMDWMDGGTTDETLQDTIKEQINKVADSGNGCYTCLLLTILSTS